MMTFDRVTTPLKWGCLGPSAYLFPWFISKKLQLSNLNTFKITDYLINATLSNWKFGLCQTKTALWREDWEGDDKIVMKDFLYRLPQSALYREYDWCESNMADWRHI